MQQYQSGYILGSVKDSLKNYVKQEGKEADMNGLLLSLSTFNVQTALNLKVGPYVPSVIAVAANIVSRGLPTLASIEVELFFAEKLKFTTKREEVERGKITFPLLGSYNTVLGESFFNALHIIDPRAKERLKYLNSSNLDSSFEKNFLLELIPEKYSYLAQLLEAQRSRDSFTHDGNRGRVDFSFELPYDKFEKRVNRYNQPVHVKRHKTYIIEVDGKSYHTDLIDDLKDFEIAQLSRNVIHIREDTLHKDAQELFDDLLSEDFIKIVSQNYSSDQYLSDALTAMILSPFGIARIQYVLLQYLMANYQDLIELPLIKLAVIERDFPCAHIALKDLNMLLNTLNQLAESSVSLPNFELEVYSTPEFALHPLRGDDARLISEINVEEFDLVLDISLLRREGVFKEDNFGASKVIRIRSSNYIHYKTRNKVFSALPIKYRDLVHQLGNEEFSKIEDTSLLLRKLLQDIFRKIDFREGQLPILNRALQLKSVIGLLPTGGGKSLTYQLAAMLQPGITVVIDPIRSLMVDQYEGLQDIGIDKCAYVNSILSTSEKSYNQKILSNGELQFVFVSPERFVIEDFRKCLSKASENGHFFSYAVIDEVHCVSEWGHDFRIPYLNLGDNAQHLCRTQDATPIPIFGLTATASFDVLADIERELKIKKDDGNAVVRFENSVRDEINYLVEEVSGNYDGLDNLNEWDIRDAIGRAKQGKAFEAIIHKEEILSRFNNDLAIRSISEKSFREFLPIYKQQEILSYFSDERDNQVKESKAIQLYTDELSTKLYIRNPFERKKVNGQFLFDYGIIVFAPHRTGPLGIKEMGFFDRYYGKGHDETFGYFMGSGDDEDAEKVDEDSFSNLRLFKENEQSVMVATKAFGMGIDKPDIRMTIHLNIPQSIESFVQEAGRAGRDGKLSVSMILFNNDSFKLNKPESTHIDKDILMYFHKNSFKGQIKERVMIHELRNNITFPNTTNLQLLTEALNENFGKGELQFIINLGREKNANRLFINTTTGNSIGFVRLDNQESGIYPDFGNESLCRQLVAWVRKELPLAKYTDATAMRDWLKQQIVNSRQTHGIERELEEMHLNQSKKLPVSFTNKYYSKKTKLRNDFKLNSEHSGLVLKTRLIKNIIDLGYATNQDVLKWLKHAVFYNLDYVEFIELLKIKDQEILADLIDESNALCLEVQKAYFAPRSQSDTAKAIYRLISIGIIDTYTIDYQNKLFYISFTKKKEEEYFNGLQELVSRYTSANVAVKEIQGLRGHSQKEILSGKATILSKCLEYLTDFIYDKIKRKRLQAIDDMVQLCRDSIGKEDALGQSKSVKEFIYYYFNAKYSRRGFVEHTSMGEISASMPDDINEMLLPTDVIDKYIGLVENAETGELISNLKHLRGATMRMLRSYPERYEYRILKSFSLFVLAARIMNLLEEAKSELINGLIEWKEKANDLNVPEYILMFKERIARHVKDLSIDSAFEDVEDLYYSSYYAKWTKEFNTKITA
jgi:ATP-dependent DNA helicase RecQ